VILEPRRPSRRSIIPRRRRPRFVLGVGATGVGGWLSGSARRERLNRWRPSPKGQAVGSNGRGWSRGERPLGLAESTASTTADRVATGAWKGGLRTLRDPAQRKGGRGFGVIQPRPPGANPGQLQPALPRRLAEPMRGPRGRPTGWRGGSKPPTVPGQIGPDLTRVSLQSGTNLFILDQSSVEGHQTRVAPRIEARAGWDLSVSDLSCTTSELVWRCRVLRTVAKIR
jgi:hypothetical protein